MAEETQTALPDISSQELFQQTQAPETPTATTPEPAAPQPERPGEPPAAVPPVVPTPPTDGGQDAAIPSWRLREEAERARQAEARAGQLEERLRQILAHQEQQKKPPDFFESPEAVTQVLIERAIGPYAERTQQTFMYLGKMLANTAHGADKVEAAEQAFLKARAEQTLDPADYERVIGSPNRYDSVVQWHKRQSVLSSVGDDPAAWFEKQLEAKLADPKFQATMLEKVRNGAASRPAVTELPPSLSNATSAASNRSAPVGDMSDQSLFAFAKSGK